MKILFVENRYTTRLWELVARRLAADGHDVHWLVQNPVFSPGFGLRHVLPFARSGAPARTATDIDLADAKLGSDRVVRYFGGKTSHYGGYADAIQRVLTAVAPQVVFGEPTQFHELITISLCKRMGIPFLFPSSTRYPPGRLTFHRNDTMDSFGGCDTDLPAGEAEALRLAIVERRLLPSYMQYQPPGWLGSRVRRWGDQWRITRGWLAGERQVTPAPWVKLRLEKRQRLTVKRWEATAHASLPDAARLGPWALYAMQMQPESNIDVWGYPWNDQVATIRAAADAMGTIGGTLVVKPNPKSKYELSDELCALVECHPHIVNLAHASRMSVVFPSATAVLSVTGTVLMEAVLAGKPVGTLGSHAMSRFPGVTVLAQPGDIADLVGDACAGRARAATPEQGAALLNQIQRGSYEGTLFDPLNQPEMATTQNLSYIFEGFRDVVSRIENSR